MQADVLMVQADEDDRMLTESILREVQHRVPMHFIAHISEKKIQLFLEYWFDVAEV